jgi:hypothetical protein
MNAQTSQTQFMLLLRQPEGPTPASEELRQIMNRFAEWMQQLGAEGVLVGSNGLQNSGKILRGPRGASVTDGPFAESKEIVGGYVMIRADTLDQAVEFARGCPGLDYGLAVEVRPVQLKRES